MARSVRLPDIRGDARRRGSSGERKSSPVAISALNKAYGSVVAVKDISLEIAAGEFLTLLGPSGSGKTTILGILAGLIVPDSGTIAIGGRDATREPPYRRDIGVVFQNYALFPHMSVDRNIGFPLSMRHLGKAEIVERVQSALALVRLEHVGERFPHQLSGGQQQRVALARALVFDPSVLLMDEPLGALDRNLRQHMQYEIRSIQKRLGITAVYVTHDQEEALVMSDRLAIMKDGEILQIGPPDQVYERPRSRFVATFLGESNLIQGQLTDVDGKTQLSVGSEDERWLLRIPPLDLEPSAGEVTVSIRPEKISFVAEGSIGHVFDNVVAARILDTIYVGDSLRYRLRGPNGLDLSLKEITSTTSTRRQVGEAVHIGWAAADTVILRD